MKLFFKLFIRLHVLIYRLTGGRVMGSFGKMQILLLTTKGRKTGRQRATPLAYVRDGENYVVAGSNGGQDHHPGWYWNLRANPEAIIQIKDRAIRAQAETASGEERARLWSKFTALGNNFIEYEKRTSREIPVVVLRPVT